MSASKPSLKIVGSDGAFGSFMAELLEPHFAITSDSAPTAMLCVPLSAYDLMGRVHRDCRIINVCSVQEESTRILLKHTSRVTSLHPLFGRRSPADKRNAIPTRIGADPDDVWYDDVHEQEFLAGFSKVARILPFMTPAAHDQLMAKTHLAAFIAAQQAKVLVDRAASVPDELLPHSFRKLREFVQTFEDMPPGTVESILANRY